ncbi:MAG: DUF4105 domain-containing protein [Xanthomonadales bacterium]|nr:DUF4105 domain-containing protein [Xanthomonadales bacterium]NIN59145.1 DUF4105 domain-containing protein [Xanthomonadales bacterium]NIN74456.1 DUF4105 domain-containing protein [Xanthomonadales bacterium]NIO13259.1 DUF4105 domain-containing protein [Xanthomonadales bacterium]NIP11538.1 DUF4105 domain-containing protein [Xanthomonadales bacterium]
MTSERRKRRLRAAFTCSWFMLAGPAAVAGGAEPALPLPAPEAGYEAWLVTYGPGEIYWQRFGHNALWLREPARGLDHTFNFGYFDFAQQGFLARFIRGRLLYFSLAQPASEEFEGYRRDGRSIRAQRLNLDAAQYRRLREHLLRAVQPANRYYRYDYFLDNCATRIRDALDLALGGALHERWAGVPAQQGFRAHTRRLTHMDYGYYLGLEAVLGRPVDRPVSRWDEMFIPSVIADIAAATPAVGGGDQTPLVREDRVLWASAAPTVPAEPPPVWPRYLLLSMAAVLLAVAASRWLAPAQSAAFAGGWLLVAAGAGSIMVMLWALTDHEVAGPNFNLLIFNPLSWLWFWTAARRPLAVCLALGVPLALLQALAPGGQYNLDVVALAGPPGLASAAWLWRHGARAAGGRGSA